MRSRAAVVGAMAVVGALVPAVARADLYNPTTAEYVPTSYYYPAPEPSFPDPPPLTFPPLDLTSPTPDPGTAPAPTPAPAPARTPAQKRVLGYTRSAKVSRQANRQMADLFARRLGPGHFDRARFIAEADKGTFRQAFSQIVRPLGWSATDYADALAAYLVSSYQIANGIGQLPAEGLLGARRIADQLRAELVKNPKMRRQTAARKQLATERLNTVTIVQVVQYGSGDATQRAAQSAATREAGRRTFGGDLGLVLLGAGGFEARPQP